MIDLHEPDAALGQPPGHQALSGEDRRGGVVEPVEVARRLRLAVDVERLGRAGLHPEGQLERLDPRGQAAIVLAARAVQLVDPPERVELLALAVGVEGRVLDVGDRVLEVGDERPLIGGGEEARRPERGPLRRLRSG